MLRDDAVTTIMNRLGNRTGSTLQTLIQTEMKLAQTDLEGEPQLPWFLFKATSSSLAAGNASLAVESDFLREVEDLAGLATIIDGVRAPLTKENYDFLCRQEDLEEAGQPEFYDIRGESYFIFPTGDAAYTLERRYYARDTVLSANVENKWLKYAPSLLIAATGVRVTRWLRDEGGLAIFTTEFAIAKRQLEMSDLAHRAAALEAYMGG